MIGRGKALTKLDEILHLVSFSSGLHRSAEFKEIPVSYLRKTFFGIVRGGGRAR
jgi:hypothetical protein